MKRYIYICSPYRGATVEERKANERAALRYCKAVMDYYPGDEVHLEAPHLFYPRFLDEDDPAQRALGLKCGLERLTDMLRKNGPNRYIAMYVFGERITEGMAAEIRLAQSANMHIVYLPADFGQGKKRARKADDPRFAEFWQAYPRKIDKDDARKAWARIAPDGAQFTRIMDGLARWKLAGSWNRDGGAYIPHPATWLNKGRWEAEPDLPEPGKGKTGKFSYFTNYDQRRYSDEALRASGLPMPGDEE